MRYRLFCIGLIISLLLILIPIAANAQGSIVATNDRAKLTFPDSIAFSVHLKSTTQIDRVVIEYGVDQLTCGTVIAEAFPTFTPGTDVDASWTWEMKQTGSQPPGSHIWWRWRVTDKAGHETVTEQKSNVWLDDQHPWQTDSGSLLNLHWYSGGSTFGLELHDSAVKSLGDLAASTGLQLDAPTDLYIYADTQDMQAAVLYEPGWTGGLAYPDHNIVIIGIAPDQIDWGKRTEAHELTHVLVGHLTFSCLGDVPTWLNEGLAVYGEGGPESGAVAQFKDAVKNDTLISVRALSGGFSEDPAKADLSYSESYSLVNFLVKQYGQDKMTSLLKALRDGSTVDDGLKSVYSFDIDGFEDAWRSNIGAKPRSIDHASPTATPIATIVPTYVPVSGAPLGPTISPTRDRPASTPISIAQAASTQNPTTTNLPAITSTTPNASPINTDVIVPIAIGLVLIIGVIFIVISRRQQRMKL
ncbi:MAG TPA: peptidase MA family metallohydrolase [Anaerolineae bacterium]|nr:peptidase MA family metallohydrolase [Anaerolineae bacterium]